MKGIISKTIRQLKITTSKVIPLATELVEKKKAILKGKSGFTELKPHTINKELKKFLESEGLTLEYASVESRRGRVEIAGVKVKVMPVAHTHYDGGVFIRVPETSSTSYENTNKVLEFLTKHGINVAKECIFVDEHTEEGACLFKASAPEE